MGAAALDSVSEESNSTTAEEFLTKLSPLAALWQPPSQWIFRGHAKACWKLIPKAHRKDVAFAAFGVKTMVPQDAPDWMHSAAHEEALLERFHQALDRAALEIPTAGISLGHDGPKVHYRSETPPHAIPLLALAQHLGLPTRLLDWTRQSFKAAYFAAAGALEIGSEETLAVWALRVDLLEILNRDYQDARVRLVTAPTVSNPNLHAQSGVFTQVRGGEVLAVEEFVKATWLDAPKLAAIVHLPWIRKTTLIRSEAPRLLRLLSYSDIDGSSMFPGHVGVVKRLKEEAFWDAT